MYKNQISVFFAVLALLFSSIGCSKKTTQWSGQAPITIVPTSTRPIQKQLKGVFDIGQGIYATNDFAGARLNGIVLTDDTLITALITPENTPINPSPWYAFKIWSEEETEISLKLTYLDGVYHRYYPRLSHDGQKWEAIAKGDYFEGPLNPAVGTRQLPAYVTMKLDLGPDTLWVAAQEIITSKPINAWVDKLAELPYVTSQKIGESREGRDLNLLKIGESDDKQLIYIMSRQHPPEITGFLAMQAFVETLTEDTELASKFRKSFNAYVVPLVNPDGVDNGHWRHNSGGIDLNRDWKNVNQTEVKIVQDWFENKAESNKGTVYFAVDFHSTWQDIYYPISPELKGNMPGLVPDMINAMSEELGLTPNIRPSQYQYRGVTSSQYFFHQFGAEALTYEIGDNTPRDLIRKKGEVSAEKLMELLLAK